MRVIVLLPIVLLLLVFTAYVGGFCVAFDINHLLPIVTHRALSVSGTDPIILLGGALLSETVVPIAIVTSILVAGGAIP